MRLLRGKGGVSPRGEDGALRFAHGWDCVDFLAYLAFDTSNIV